MCWRADHFYEINQNSQAEIANLVRSLPVTRIRIQVATRIQLLNPATEAILELLPRRLEERIHSGKPVLQIRLARQFRYDQVFSI